VCYEPDDDELVDAMLFELQIQIGVGKAAGTPMLEGHDITRLRSEFTAISPPQVPFSKILCDQAAFWIGAMYCQLS